MQLQIAKEQIESRDREIFSLKADISDISQENNVLVSQKPSSKMSTLEHQEISITEIPESTNIKLFSKLH